MNYPKPVQGLVVRFRYLWKADSDKGLSDSGKDRPCAIVVVASKKGTVYAAPITHSPPEKGEEDLSIKIPAEVCAAIGLDDDENWVRTSELNEFYWPTKLLRTLPRDPSTVVYGMIGGEFFTTLQKSLAQNVRDKRLKTVDQRE